MFMQSYGVSNVYFDWSLKTNLLFEKEMPKVELEDFIIPTLIWVSEYTWEFISL